MKAIKSIIRGAKTIAKWGGVISAFIAALDTLQKELDKIEPTKIEDSEKF